jgi:hypothetical protein
MVRSRGSEVTPIQEVRSKKEKKEKRIEPTALADPRHSVFADYAHKTFKLKNNCSPTWADKDYAGLKALLKRQPDMLLPEIVRRWNNFLGSTEEFTISQGDSLLYFCSSFDRFLKGPVTEKISGFRAKPEPDISLTFSKAGTNR